MSCCAGSEDGRVHVWSTESGMKVAVLDGKHSGPINTLQFNPRYMTFASACTNMVRSHLLSLTMLLDKLRIKGHFITLSLLLTDFLASVYWWLIEGRSSEWVLVESCRDEGLRFGPPSFSSWFLKHLKLFTFSILTVWILLWLNNIPQTLGF